MAIEIRRGSLGEMQKTQSMTVGNKPLGHLGWDGRESNL